MKTRTKKQKVADKVAGKLTGSLPPDPEGMNEDRSDWAETALEQFSCSTNMSMEYDLPEIVGDFLADLMHFCDRNNLSFDERLANARMHYEEETAAE